MRTQATFLGWSLTQNELIESQEAEEAAGIITELTMPGADETVYAVWAFRYRRGRDTGLRG